MNVFGKISVPIFLLLGVLPSSSQKLIRVNQVGYRTMMPKVATVAGMDATSFEIKENKTDETVYKGVLEQGRYWMQSMETIQKIDFTDFDGKGIYYIQIGDEKSYPFMIADSPFDGVLHASLRAFYYWRASAAIEPPYSISKGYDFSRKLGHPDTLVFVHRSAASDGRHAESVIAAPKGWYDAGDYNKYVVNAGITLHQLMLSYELFPEFYRNLDLNIPENTDSLPDIYNEIKWEIDWLLAMQDPVDGGVYHKLTTLHFSRFVQPDEDDADRYVVKKSTAAALDFASVMAMFYRVFGKLEPNYASKTLVAAKRAWKWAEANPKSVYNDPDDVKTGTYADDFLNDEFFWTASELFLATGEKSYYDKMEFFQKFETPTWRMVNTLGLIDLRLHQSELPSYVDKDWIDSKFRSVVQTVYNQFKFASGRVALKKFVWGSNGEIAMNGVLLGLAYKVYGKPSYLEAMIANFDYLLGSNPTEYCFVSGFGSKYPKNLHDRRMFSDGLEEPIPGYLCGGANPNQVSDCGRSSYPSIAPARSYLDENCSYSTNEIAINWNAPFVLLATLSCNLQGDNRDDKFE